MKKRINILVCNHYDLAWRRRAYEPLVDQGRSFVSYADLQRYGIEENLRFCRKYPFYKFNIECVSVLRHFLRSCPQYNEEVLKLMRQNRCSVPQSGDNIIDTNLVTGESIVRNYTEGRSWLLAHFGETSSVCVRNDAFGNSAQLPQIAAQCGCDWIWGLSYTPVEGSYWRGLDGTTLFVGTLADAGSGGSWKKYAPCPACRGRGCSVCAGLGIDREAAESSLEIEFHEEVFRQADEALLSVTSEEMLPTEKLIRWYEQMRENYDVRFVTYNDLHDLVKDRLTAAPSASELLPTAEHNPNNTGCYTTRIRTKQEIRILEYRLLSLEKLAALFSWNGGTYPFQALDQIWEKLLTVMAHDIVTGEHVDAVYEDYLTWIDQLKHMIGDTLQQVTRPFSEQNEAVTVWNPNTLPYTGIVRIPTEGKNSSFSLENGEECTVVDREEHSVSVFISNLAAGKTIVMIPKHDEQQTVAESEEPDAAGSYGNILQASESHVETTESCVGASDLQVEASDSQVGASGSDIEPSESVSGCRYRIENGSYRILADDKGILSVYDLENDFDLTPRNRRPIRLIYEHDEGSPWATLSDDRKEVPVQMMFKKIRREIGLQSLTYSFCVGTTHSYAIHALHGELQVILYRGSNRIDLRVRVFSDDYNHRLRVAFTTGREMREKHLYGVPYGMIERQPYEPSYFWAGSNGDWPAVNWAGIERSGHSVAVFDRGTPSYHITSEEDASVIAVSVLRSPIIPTYLHEPSSYSMTAWDGMRDTGWHEIELAFRSYAGLLSRYPVSAEAESYACGVLPLEGKLNVPSTPTVMSGNGRITALFRNSSGDFVLRLVECRGQSGEISIWFPEPVREVFQTDLKQEKRRPLEVTHGETRFPVSPFEIVTLLFS